MARVMGAGSAVVGALLWVGGAAGCGETKRLPAVLPAGVGVQFSGSRLLALAATSEQGPTVYLHALYDTEREEFCAFRQASDGSFRCFPTAVLHEVFQGSNQCPRRLAADVVPSAFPTGGDPRYVQAGTSTACGANFEIYEIGSLVVPEPPCDNPDLAPFELYELGPRVPDSAFVRAELVPTEATDALGAQYLVAADGTTQWYSFFDHEYGEECTSERLDDDAVHCLPASTLTSGNYWASATGDLSTCAPLVAEGKACRPAVFGKVGMFGGEVHRAVPVEQVTGTAFDTPTFRECLKGARDFMQAPFALTEVVDAQEFPRLAEIEVQQGLLTATVWGTEDGTTLAPVRQDRRLRQSDDEYCELAIASDGKDHCLPWPRVYRFADRDCIEPLLGDPASAEFSRFAVSTSYGRTSVYEAGALFTGPIYELHQSGPDVVCEANAPDTDAAAVYRGVEVSPDEFVRYTRVELQP